MHMDAHICDKGIPLWATHRQAEQLSGVRLLTYLLTYLQAEQLSDFALFSVMAPSLRDSLLAEREGAAKFEFWLYVAFDAGAGNTWEYGGVRVWWRAGVVACGCGGVRVWWRAGVVA